MIWLLVGSTLPALVIAWAAAHWVRRQAPRWSLVDRRAGVPTGGGLAIWLGMVAPAAVGQLILWLVVHEHLSAEILPELARTHLDGLYQQSGKLWIMLAAGTVLLVLGLVDDLKNLDWRLRLVVHALVALFMVWQGWRLTAFIELPLVTAALSLLWIVGLVNSFNMLDNMDGLSSGVAAIVAALLAAVVLHAPQPQWFVAGFSLMLLGALAGFWWHNRPPARLFMGNAGSYFIGFLIAVTTLAATFAGGEVPRHAILAPLCLLAVPLYDTVSVVLIRLRQGRSPFVGDQSHFSHRLVDLGLSKKHAVWTIYLATATCGLGALLLHQVDAVGATLIMALVGCVLAIIAILETAGRRR